MALSPSVAMKARCAARSSSVTELGIQQRAVLGAARVIDRVAHAQIVQPVGAAGMLAAGDQKRVDQPLTRDQGPAGALELGVKKAEIERRVVDDKRRVA